MHTLTIEYCALGLGVWLFSWGANRTYLTFKGLVS